MLSHAEEIKAGLYKSAQLLEGDEGGVIAQLKEVMHTLTGMAGVYAPAEELASRLESSYIELKDIAQEESSFFTSVGHPFPAVCIRTSTERPEALDKACFILSGIDEKGLLQAVDVAVEMNRNRDLGIPVPDYVDENVSDKVVKIIQSYTGVVNKMVWRKDV